MLNRERDLGLLSVVLGLVTVLTFMIVLNRLKLLRFSQEIQESNFSQSRSITGR